MEIKKEKFVKIDEIVREIKKLIKEYSEEKKEIGMLKSEKGYGEII